MRIRLMLLVENKGICITPRRCTDCPLIGYGDCYNLTPSVRYKKAIDLFTDKYDKDDLLEVLL